MRRPRYHLARCCVDRPPDLLEQRIDFVAAVSKVVLRSMLSPVA